MKQKFTKHWGRLLLTASLLLGVCYTSTWAQQQVSGVVSDDKGEPLIGVNVLIKGTTTGTVTDFDGQFELTAHQGDTLEFSYVGYDNTETIVNDEATFDVILGEDIAALEQVVVVGYGTQTRKEVTGAVASVSSETIAKTPTPDLATALQGQVAGVNVQAASGRPGEAANVQIRGLGSISSSGLGPLYVVDGIPFDQNPNIPPEQIESVDILKDGASASVYGTRAANGVILITTKRGEAGGLKVDFGAYGGVQNITSGTPLMNSQQQMYAEEVKLNALGREPLIFFFNPKALEYDSDFVGDVQNDNASIQNYNLSVSGGTKHLTLSLNTDYFDQEGVLINSGFNRFSNRITAEFNKGRFSAFATIGFTEENREQEPWALYEYSITQRPWQPPLNGLQSAGQNSVEIPVRNAILYSYLSRELENVDDREVNSSNVAINLGYEIVDGLRFKVNLGRNTWDYRRKFFRPQYLVYNSDGSYNPTASREQAILMEDYIWTTKDAIEYSLNYDRSFGLHNINALALLSYERFSSKTLGTGVIFSEDASNDLQTLGSGSEAITPYSYDEERTLSGKLIRLQYDYDKRYLLSASFRRDGSSKFSEDNRYGDFFGFSAGWNISEEEFFNSSWIDGLKLRASWAQVGNQSIDSYSFTPIIESGVNYPFGPNEDLAFGFVQRRYVDPDIQWETTISTNIGLDLSLLDYRLNVTLDLYENRKKDMLLQERLPASAGVYQPRADGIYDVRVTNAGNMVNRGVELGLSYQNRTDRELQYRITGTFTMNQNEVTDLNGVERGYANGRPIVSLGADVDYTTFLAEGYEAGAFFLLQHAGVIKTQEQLDEYKVLDASAQLGDMMYIDENQDGVINDSDRVYAGSGQADFEAGLGVNLTYKNFDFYAQLYYSHGAEIYNGARLYAYTQGRHLEQYYMWSPQNADSDVPTDRENAFHNNVRARSDYFLEDGTYLRFRTLTLGYTLKNLDGIGIDRLRFYVTGFNPFTITNYTGYDPEIGGDGIFTRGVDQGNYPVTRQFLFGLQLGF